MSYQIGGSTFLKIKITLAITTIIYFLYNIYNIEFQFYIWGDIENVRLHLKTDGNCSALIALAVD